MSSSNARQNRRSIRCGLALTIAGLWSTIAPSMAAAAPEAPPPFQSPPTLVTAPAADGWPRRSWWFGLSLGGAILPVHGSTLPLGEVRLHVHWQTTRSFGLRASPLVVFSHTDRSTFVVGALKLEAFLAITPRISAAIGPLLGGGGIVDGDQPEHAEGAAVGGSISPFILRLGPTNNLELGASIVVIAGGHNTDHVYPYYLLHAGYLL